jgi:hypothetical protein
LQDVVLLFSSASPGRDGEEECQGGEKDTGSVWVCEYVGHRC